ncbi:MAG TPA: glycosyltransferase [Chthoniobacterales bacterium]|nr:glycosyltransferase [Chthoniobacterales bacterium]
MRLGYLYSRYPVLSQTFCDTEMLELERRGFSLLLGAVHPPLTSIRHGHAARLKAPLHYAPPSPILKLWEERARDDFRWPDKLIHEHERKYGTAFKPALRARNAAYFAYLFAREGIRHFHVHFANRAAHTALFLKEMVGIPFSVTAHGQDFMSDLGSDELLREICAAAEFIAVETDYSRGLLSGRCPEAMKKIHRVYNGMDFSNFVTADPPTYTTEAVRIVSIGRLVEFKGFEHLIAACVLLKQRGLGFVCEIIGDGPLRESLQKQINACGLNDVVTLSGALPQQAVFEKLKACEIFTLASTLDRAGASDVFPTVILEAMASARPVVSTAIAGIPEAVVHGLTGLVVPSGDPEALANALDRLIRDQWLRFTFGSEGRARVERYFQVETTIAPLMALFERIAGSWTAEAAPRDEVANVNEVAYLIDRWTDPGLPFLEGEMLELERQDIPVVGFVCQPAPDMSLKRLHKERKQFVSKLQFLPDPMVIEAEWQTNATARNELEEDRAREKHRAPSGIFLEQARFAIALRTLMRERKISHVHATSSRMLLCAVMLKKLLGVTVSATIEADPVLPAAVLQSALGKCEGGRIADPTLRNGLSDSFLRERPTSNGLVSHAIRKVGGSFGIEITRPPKVLQEWAELLVRWR